MAEQLKEFANVALTAASFDSSGEYNILTNNSTTQAVIKDIDAVAGTNVTNSNIKIKNGISTIATGGLSSGSEIIPVSRSVKLSLDPIPSAGTSKTFKAYTLSSQAYQNYVDHELVQVSGNTYPMISGTSYVNSFTNGSEIAMTNVMITNSSFFFIDTAGTRAWHCRWDGNSDWQLRYAAVTSGVGTSSVTIGSWVNATSSLGISSYMCPTFDPDNNKFYFQQNFHRLYEVNMTTLAVTTHGGAFTGITGNAAQSTYNVGAFSNGFYFANQTNQVNQLVYTNPVTGKKGRIYRGSTFLIGANHCLAVCYNPTDKNYYITTTDGGGYMNLNYVTEAELNAGGNHTPTFVGQFQLGHNNMNHMGSSNIGYQTYTDTSSRVVIVQPTTSGYTTINTYTNSTLTYSSATIVTTASSAVPLNQITAEMSIKVSGVEITGVS